MKTDTTHLDQANGSGPAADPMAAESSGQKAASKPSDNTPDGRTEAQSPPQPVTPGKTQEAHRLKRAAQSEHKPSADGGSAPDGANDCAVAGGDTPQSPHTVGRTKPTKKKRRQKKDNHLSFRCLDDEMDVVERRMASAGETQSEAVRSIIREYGNTTGIVCLSPKAPPEQLEDLLGILGDWRRDFVKAQPRLNIPTPKTDDERYEQVKEWRKAAKVLLKKISKIEPVLISALEAVTSLDPGKVTIFQSFIPSIQRWQQDALGKGKKSDAMFWSCLLQLFDDMGIKPNP